jgi:hypothetical protein
VAAGQPARVIVDPEALILMSFWILPHEQRLADVAWSWTSVNSSLLSIQRLRNMRALFPAEAGANLAGLAELRLSEANDPRWKSLRVPKSPPLRVRQTKVRAVEPRFGSWAALMLQLRLGLGVGVKADVLTFVLGIGSAAPEWTSVAIAADALTYTPAAVRRAADDLSKARFIRTLDAADTKVSPHRMFSGQANAWSGLLGISTHHPGWGFWTERFLFVVELVTWLDREVAKPASPYARDVKAREILTRHGPAIRNDSIVDSHDFAAADLNYQYLVSASKAFTAWLENRG